METEAGFGLLSANTSNTDLKTLADLATMGEKATTHHSRVGDPMDTVSGNGTGETHSPAPHSLHSESVNAQEHIAKAFDRLDTLLNSSQLS